jgi:SAM-dependent methyltransferase
VEDPYVTATYRWWHLSSPSPELVAAEAEGQLGAPGIAVDLGCGLGSELAYLVGRGWAGFGVDLLTTPLAWARGLYQDVTFVQADVRRLPFRTGTVDLLLDRGCFHYLDAPGRASYVREAGRVLRLGGRLILRMCLNSAGVPNGLDEGTIVTTFDAWRITSMERLELVSDTRTMLAVIATLVRPASVPR